MLLSHHLVGDQDAPKLGFVLHGVLGAGHNLRSLIKNLAHLRPEYRFALIDLRYHGKSLGASPPHTLASCVDDLIELTAHLGQAPNVVIGHSMGGKVALEYGRRHERPSPQEKHIPPDFAHICTQIWTLDSDPGAQQVETGHQVLRVLGALKSSPGPFSSRANAVQAIEEHGLSTGLAHWLGTSLERKPDGFVWRFDLEPIELLLEDYFRLDLWPYLEDEALGNRPHAIKYELLLAENSDRWSGSMKERAGTLQKIPRIRVHVLRDSGHWVHVDNPAELLKILAENLD